MTDGSLRIFTDNNTFMEMLHGDICSLILKAFYSTYTVLPFGLDRLFYANFLTIEMQSLGLKVEVNKKQPVSYRDNIIGEFTFDFVVNNAVIIQIENQKSFLHPEQVEVCKNYLKLTDFEVLLLLNFSVELEHKRLLLTNDFKKKI